MQRLFDILFSVLMLILLSPLLLTLIVILRSTGEGEVFFLQSRVGLRGKHFAVYKFATMLKNSPNMGTGTITLYKDSRVLPFGGWLRYSKINELPQLINILKGNMSFIGPRPQTQRCFDAFPVSTQKLIIKVKPGLSGLGSIIFRNEEKIMHSNKGNEKFYDDVIMPYKGSLEEWYVDNQDMRSYFCLIGLTVWVILFANSGLIWKTLKDLPLPPSELKEWL